MDKFSTALRTLRKALKLTQHEFARMTEISVASIAHYETDTRGPDPATAVRLCYAALRAGQIEVAEVFARAIPGVADGLLIPRWRVVTPKRK